MPRPSWIPLFERLCGWPDTPAHSLALDQWHLSEGMPDDWHNPMAMGAYKRTPTDDMAGCYVPKLLPDGSANTYNVLRCPSWEAGAVEFSLNMERPEYYRINAMFQGQGMQDDKATIANIYWAINTSSWCPKCQSGKYPIVMHNWLYGKNAGVVQPVDMFRKLKAPAPVPTSLHAAWAELMRQFKLTIPHQIRRIEAARQQVLNANREGRPRA